MPRGSGWYSPAVVPRVALLNVHSCQTFPEDAAILLDEIDPDFFAVCLLLDIEIIWGRNFKADEELAVAVAGVYGRNRLVARGPYESVMMSVHAFGGPCCSGSFVVVD
jgi:hypothetical protein